MAAPQAIVELVEIFDRNIESYRSGQYNEAQIRQSFINPLFIALGWDVYNEKGYAEAYKDVVIEDSIKVGSSTKAPDYSFRIGGTRKFFVEAKKPSVNLKDDISPAFQLRRYSWSAKLPLGVLTDFEELAVYDGRIQPVKNDKASKARVKYFTYKEYVDRWDEIAAVFSREEVLKGSFDKYVESSKAKRGTAEVDTAFLREIEAWRDMLARNIALRNPDLTTRELNFAVQRTIDRIVFLRICEDRGIEKYGWLHSLLEGQRVYPRLCEFFRRADERYNSGLFHFSEDPARQEPPDELTLSLEIDDKTLKDIIRDLYYPDSPYEFSVLPPEILGQVYEQFLGKVISLTAGHRAKVEYKPEVRKAGGVYYTPSYIVNYIVENTVGKLLEGQTPTAASELRVLDPACGSGSFLIGAYQRLLDWHRDWYVDKLVPLLEAGQNAASKEVQALLPEGYTAPNKKRGRKKEANRDQPPDFPIFEAKGGEWKLTTRERRRILLNNIYGVDIDPQAVEVTKLSLHLKVLEGESEETLSKQLKLFQERALPDLGQNIKCGNSLIGWDILEGRPDMTEEEIDRINPFDWEGEFPGIMRHGGFDAVIGNPPYGAEFPETTNNYLKNKFYTYMWRGESYLCFVENAVKSSKLGGNIGYIIPDTYLNLGFTQSLRDFLLKNTRINEVVLLPSNVFSGATVDTTLLFAERSSETKTFHDVDVFVKTFNKKVFTNKINNPDRKFLISTKFWHKQNAFNVFSNESEIKLISNVSKAHKKLSQLTDIFYGIKAYQVGKGKPPQTKEIRDDKPFTSDIQEEETFLPFFDGKHIGRYELLWKENNWIKYGPWLAEPRIPSKFEGEKILIRKIVGMTLIATYIPKTSYCNTLLYVLKINEDYEIDYKYLLGILNSNFVGWYFRKRFQISDQDTFPQILIRDIQQIPVPVINNSRHDQMVGLVERMLDLHNRLAETKAGHEKTLLQRQIEATDKQIDRLVYELYGLTEEEIKIVEEATA